MWYTKFMASVHTVTNYIISRVAEERRDLSLLKLQKLLYYVQAWYLVHHDGQALFDNDFQAWVHGPVCREVYDRFATKFRLYDCVGLSDIGENADVSELSEAETTFVNEVLEVYASFTGSQLEQLTHSEAPWIEARAGLSPTARCERVISRERMREYYAARIAS